MATVNKDFKIKSGLIVEGTTATINGFDALTKKQADQDYIVGLIGGTATSANTPSTVVKRDASGNFAAGTITAAVTGNVTGNLTGNVTGNVSGSAGTVTSLTGNSTTGLTEGTNLYFTDERAQDAIGNNLGTGLSYNDSTGAVSVTSNTYDAYGSASAAQSAAISAAASDATTKANAAQTAAEATASADATSKANAAQAAAASDATSKANAAQAAAIAASQTGLDTKLATAGGTMSGAIAMGTNKITGLGYPTANTDAATKAYVDTTVQGIDWKASVRAASTANVNLSSDLQPGDVIDGVTLAYADRVLLKNQTTASQNGIYIVQNTGFARSIDANETLEVTANFAVFVEEGTTNADSGFTLTNDGAVVVGTTALVFTQFTGLGQIVAGIGLDKTGNTLDIDSTVVTLTGTQTLTNKTITSPAGLVKEDVGLRNVDNTTDANKPVSTAQATAIATAKTGAEATASADATSKVSAEAALRVSGDAASVSTAAADATSKVAAEATARNTAIATAISTEVSDRNTAITSAVDAINTDVIEEGTSNKYFTTTRAKTAAAALIVGATKTNITITGDENGLVISAENGVADSTTSDLTEGSNLYFTNARAVSAVQAVVPNFTSVDLNSVAKQVAATLSAPTAGVQTAHAFAKADYRSAEYLVKIAYGTHTEISKVLLTLDTSDNIAITEYGVVGTNGSLSTVSAGISGANVQLQVTTTNNNSTVTVMGTLLK